MKYPNEGRRKARSMARERAEADLRASIKALLDQGWPRRNEAQDMLLIRLTVSYNETFGRLPTQEELLLILGKFLQEHGDHKDEKDYYPFLGEMVKHLEQKTSEQGSPLMHPELME